MNELLKYVGIVFIILGVGVLGYYSYNHITTNGPLVFSLALMVGGMVTHIVVNKILI